VCREGKGTDKGEEREAQRKRKGQGVNGLFCLSERVACICTGSDESRMIERALFALRHDAAQ